MPIFGRDYPQRLAVQVLTQRPAAGSNNFTLTCDAGSYALFGQAQGLNRGIVVAASQGTYTLTGKAQTLLGGKFVSATTGSYSLSGQAAGLNKNLQFPVAQGSYTLSGKTVVLGEGMPASAGSYALNGIAVTLTKTGANLYTLLATTGVYGLNGKDSTLTGPFVGGGKMYDPYGWYKRENRVENKPVVSKNYNQTISLHSDSISKAAAHMSSLGGQARAASLTAKQRTTIASNAAKARWK